MVHITFGEAFLFFGAVVLSAIIGIASSFLVQSSYDVFGEHLRPAKKTIFLTSLVVVIGLVGICFLIFNFLSQVEDPQTTSGNISCINQNITNIVNNYSVAITEIHIENKPPVVSVEELKYLIQKNH